MKSPQWSGFKCRSEVAAGTCPRGLGVRSAVAGKARVHELAKELGVESKTVLAKLKDMGEFVKSASSTVEAPVARRLRAALEAGSAPAPAAPVAPPASPAPAATPRDPKV